MQSDSQTQAGIAFAKAVAQATCQEPGSRTQRRCAHNHNGQAKERNRGSKPLSKNVNLRSQSNNERPRPAKAIAWSEQGSTAPISTKYRKTAPQKWIAQSNATQRRNRPLGTQCPALQRGNRRIQGGHRGNSQSPLPSLAAGGTKNKRAIKIENHLSSPHA